MGQLPQSSNHFSEFGSTNKTSFANASS